MHGLAFVLVPPEARDVQRYVDEALEPYSLHREEPPYFIPISPEEQEAMRQHFGLDAEAPLLPHVKEWASCEGLVHDGQLGYLSTDNRRGAWDWWEIGGRWDGELTGQPRPQRAPSLLRELLRVAVSRWFQGGRTSREKLERNRLPVHALTPELRKLATAIVSPAEGWKDSWAYAPGPEGPQGTDAEAQWRAALDAILARHPDHAVVAVDYHS